MSIAYDKITNAIIEQMENGNIPWIKNWKGEKAINYITRKPYKGINTLLLPYPGEYLTFNQAKQLGGNVKKGEKASLICFYQFIQKENGDGEEETYPLLKYYNVFHISQCEGIESKCEAFLASNKNSIIEAAEKIINDYISKQNVKLNIVNGSDRAYYSESEDKIVMPELKQFTSENHYYATAFHEMTHSTGHKDRLDRFSKQKTHSFGSKDYSKEELIAEIGSSFLNNHVGIDNKAIFENTVAYIQSWIKKLKDDKRMIMSASSQAQKAVNLILGNDLKEEND